MTDRNQKRKEYDEQVKMLDQNFAAAQNRRSEAYNRSAAAEQEDAAAALRKKYVENRFSVKRLPQVAAAKGLSGGSVKNAFRSAAESYGEGRENLIRERDRAVAKLLESYSQGSEKDYEAYRSRLAALRRKYADVL